MYYLYGAPHSAYTAKARSYLIKQGVAFEERAFGHPKFMGEILPAIQRFFIPVLETPDGAFIQDTSDIIDHFEGLETLPMPARPNGALTRAISHLFDLFGGEGMLRAGMYYRWFFDDENMDFIEDQFGLFMAPTMPAAQRLEVTRNQTGAMRRAANFLGCNAETAYVIEASYLEFLDAFNAHLIDHPYLLGGTPSLGDYGLQVMLYAHLSRDPYPSKVMKNRAQAVYRFTERMNQPGRCAPEYINHQPIPFEDGVVPETLRTMMRLVGQDFGPEIAANIALHNEWLDENPVKEGDIAPIGGDKPKRAVGKVQFDLRGTQITCAATTYRLYMVQRLQDWVDSLAESDAQMVQSVFAETGCAVFINARLRRRVERQNNQEVWGSPRA